MFQHEFPSTIDHPLTSARVLNAYLDVLRRDVTNDARLEDSH